MPPRIDRRPPSPGVEWEFERLTIPRDFSRSLVTRMLVHRAEHGGWEVDRVGSPPTAPDGWSCAARSSASGSARARLTS